MNPSLRQETDKLTRSWMRHSSEELRDYLVAEVEDPRLNLQSIFSRHFLAWNLFDRRFEPLMEEEYRFSGVMNSLLNFAGRLEHPEDVQAVIHALGRGADNAEGLEIPHHILQAYSRLPVAVGEATVPNYIQEFLEQRLRDPSSRGQSLPVLDTFQPLWSDQLERTVSTSRPSVLEPACGSANDYRFMHRYGFASHIDYTGFDLCAKNVENARQLFPDQKFEVGNVFQIDAPDDGYDLCLVHDLLEHLSLEGIHTAVGELCRVTRTALCVHFFSMDETPEHLIRPVDEYHWNILSMGRMRELFASHGFHAQVFHAATFLRQQAGCPEFHNLNAYTFVLL